MRVLHVIATLEAESGGPAKACLEMAEAVARRGHQVDIFTTDWRSSASASAPVPLAAPGCRIVEFSVGVPRFWKASLPLARALWTKAAQYDVLHVHSLYLFHNLVAPIAARRADRPYIVRPHGLLDPYIRGRHRLRKAVMEMLFQNRAMRRAAAIHYTSADELRISQAHACGSPGVVIPLGVDLPEPPLAARRNANRILFLSRLHPKKGLDLLVPAFATLRQDWPDAELVVAGPDDGALASTKALVARHGVQDRVRFPGMLRGAEKAQAFAEAGLFVLPSYSENFGIAVAEAMAAGLPVVVTDQVNIHNDIATANAGLVVPCDAASLAAAMRRLLSDRAMAEAMGRNGRTLVATRYSWTAIGAELEALYRRLAAETGPR